MSSFTICRFNPIVVNKPIDFEHPHLGAVIDKEAGLIVDLTERGLPDIDILANDPSMKSILANNVNAAPQSRYYWHQVLQHSPLGKILVAAAGVTYENSALERNREASAGTGTDVNIYTRVYFDQNRGETFLKDLGESKGTGETVGIRDDSGWNVPEPELVILFNSRGEIVGYTAGNDMSSREIEGANPLYLPQAKWYDNAFSAGPWLEIGPKEEEARTWNINIKIIRNGNPVFEGNTSVGKMNRSFTFLRDLLFSHKTHTKPLALSSGTGIVPPKSDPEFTLQLDDLVMISISGIGGVLENKVQTIKSRVPDLPPVE